MKIQYFQYNSKDRNKYTKNNKKKHIFIKILSILIAIGIIGFIILFNIYGFKPTINKGIEVLNNIFSPVSNSITIFFNNLKGLNDVYYNIDKNTCKTYYYVNNNKRADISINALPQTNDVKAIIETDTYDRLVNYSDGYCVSLPQKLEYDFSVSPIYIKAFNENTSITISCETSPYADIWEYIDYYQNRFFLDEKYQQANNIKLNKNTKEEINGYTIKIISITRNTESDQIDFNTYSYIYIKLSGQNYMRFMIKSKEYNEEHINICNNIAQSFTQIDKQYASKYTIEYYPIENPNWNNKTKTLYKQYQTSNDLSWGIFAADIYNEGINKTIPNIEKKLDYEFDVILMYNHIGVPLPLESMKKVCKDNRIIELTLQTSYANNTELFGVSPMFDILEGRLDNEIRTLAKEIMSLDTSILFRLNNEMNTDWTSYCGMANLCDPEIYIQVWQKIYNMFKEEGVTNCIWIYNPNDNNYPPSNWNNFLAYYPGNEYVQMIGITGYNTGTYYADITNETWKEFEDIYNNIQQKYEPHFSSFNWIITEFASSSVGGDKATWINNMFNVISKYKNIKVAVWFSAADYDDKGNVARPYWLDETQETLDAFKKGIKKI